MIFSSIIAAMAEINKKVFVAMSGGVDSSVAALLLKNQGYNATGVFIRSYNLDGCAEKDAEDARRVAEHLGIPFYVFDFENEYKKEVVDYMIDGYKKGITPNPDVMCNKKIKFGLFLKKALALGADCIATGHYAKIRNKKSKIKNTNQKLKMAYKLFQANDLSKDQSYFLWTLTQEQLRHCLFPIGDYLKSEVRVIARKADLPTAEKKDSQGICFLGKVSLADFLKKYIPEKKGPVFNAAGEKIGEHKGAQFYTIGQRRIKVSNIKNQKSNSSPFYVADKNMKANVIVVVEGSNDPALYKKEIELKNVNFIIPPKFTTCDVVNFGFSFSLPVLARVRYRQSLTKAKLVIGNLKLGNKKTITNYRLLFSKPVKFIAPGQSAVFYSRRNLPAGRQVLGGGVIC